MKLDLQKPTDSPETASKRVDLGARGARGESALGYWTTDRDGICRFTPVRLPTLAAHLHGLTPSLDGFAPFSPVVKAQALFVLNRYLCGGVALRDSGELTWPELLLVHGSGTQTSAQVSPPQTSLSAAERLFDQQRHFAQALKLLRSHPLTIAGLLAAQSCLCPNVPKSGQGRLRRCDVWTQGSSVHDAKFVAVAAQGLQSRVQQLIDDINRPVGSRSRAADETSPQSGKPAAPTRISAREDRVRVHADFGFAAQISLLGLHPFIDGNGRVARVLFQALAASSGDATDAALFAASTLLVSRVLQQRIWLQSLWRARFGLEDVNVFMAVCRQTVEIGMELCSTLLDGLQTAWGESDQVADLVGWLPTCPLIRIDHTQYPLSKSARVMTVHLPNDEQGTVASAAIEFLLSFELALRDCVEMP